MYTSLRNLKARGLINDDGIRRAITKFAIQTEKFIDDAIRSINARQVQLGGRNLTKKEITEVVDEVIKKHKTISTVFGKTIPK